MTERAKINAYMFIQWILIASFSLSVLLTGPDEHSVTISLISAALLGLGIVVGGAALVAHRKINGTILVKPSPEPGTESSLVTCGIYSKTRHPIYLAVILIFLAIALFNSHWSGIILVIAIFFFYFQKLQFEESLLLREYPEYAVYRKSTGALVPRVLGVKKQST